MHRFSSKIGVLVIGFPIFIALNLQAISQGLQGLSSVHSMMTTGPLLKRSS